MREFYGIFWMFASVGAMFVFMFLQFDKTSEVRHLVTVGVWWLFSAIQVARYELQEQIATKN